LILLALSNREKPLQRKKCFVALNDQQNKSASAGILSAYETSYGEN
jgi:hypothetical protein